MAPVSSVMKFDVEKFDRRMVFSLWQVQVNDVLIQSGLHKMRKVWAYCPSGASSAKGSKIAYVASLVERYDDILESLRDVSSCCVMVELCQWLRNFQGKPTWKQHHKISARFIRHVPRKFLELVNSK
ncbi:hypothetical protein PIB30_048077 [Stylosanthes scabra]|uniref:Uncharacterized protein n=1 Tax=Stylosanthes scabra TaxID=79078 RepID=A0ABU6VGC9_9FABA|nr:hypothetical protein [Stylosanthes scabra]